MMAFTLLLRQAFFLFLLLVLRTLQGLSSSPSHAAFRRRGVAAAARTDESALAWRHRASLEHLIRRTNSMTTLRAGGAATAIEKVTSDDDDDDKELKSAKEALKSMQYCSKAAFFSVAADVVLILLQNDILTSRTMTWTDGFELLDSLNLLAFGFGIRKVASIYNKGTF